MNATPRNEIESTDTKATGDSFADLSVGDLVIIATITVDEPSLGFIDGFNSHGHVYVESQDGTMKWGRPDEIIAHEPAFIRASTLTPAVEARDETLARIDETENTLQHLEAAWDSIAELIAECGEEKTAPISMRGVAPEIIEDIARESQGLSADSLTGYFFDELRADATVGGDDE